MKEINIRFKTQEEIHNDCNSIPFIIAIDGEIQKDVNRFSIDLKNNVENLDEYTYVIEKFLKYPLD